MFLPPPPCLRNSRHKPAAKPVPGSTQALNINLRMRPQALKRLPTACSPSRFVTSSAHQFIKLLASSAEPGRGSGSAGGTGREHAPASAHISCHRIMESQWFGLEGTSAQLHSVFIPSCQLLCHHPVTLTGRKRLESPTCIQ